MNFIIIKITVVCLYVRAGGHQKPLDSDSKTFFSLCKATAGRYIRDPTNTASKSASFRLKEALLQSVVQKFDCEVGLRGAAR